MCRACCVRPANGHGAVEEVGSFKPEACLLATNSRCCLCVAVLCVLPLLVVRASWRLCLFAVCCSAACSMSVCLGQQDVALSTASLLAQGWGARIIPLAMLTLCQLSAQGGPGGGAAGSRRQPHPEHLADRLLERARARAQWAQGGSREARRRVGSRSDPFIFESARLRSPALLVCAERLRLVIGTLGALVARSCKCWG